MQPGQLLGGAQVGLSPAAGRPGGRDGVGPHGQWRAGQAFDHQERRAQQALVGAGVHHARSAHPFGVQSFQQRRLVQDVRAAAARDADWRDAHDQVLPAFRLNGRKAEGLTGVAAEVLDVDDLRLAPETPLGPGGQAGLERWRCAGWHVRSS